MRLFVPALAAISLFALSGCEKVKETVGVSDEVHFSPGRWETKIKMTALEMPGMPPELKAAIDSKIGQEQTVFQCLTPEEAAKPSGKFFGAEANEQCSYDKFDTSGGKIDAVMSCKGEQGIDKATMSGTYTAETYKLAMAVDGAAGPTGPMNMKMEMKSRRVGDCDGSEAR